MREYLAELWDSEWSPVSLPAFVTSAVFYGLFLLYAARDRTGFLLIDNVNLIVHEAGHLLFSWLGNTMSLWGGTILQWMVPLLLAMYFFVNRNAVAYAFCLFFFFENWLYTATYMADARAQVLPLLVVGDPEQGGHDWFRIFYSVGLLNYDTRIGGIVRAAGWLGMISVVAWLTYRFAQYRKRAAQPERLEPPRT